MSSVLARKRGISDMEFYRSAKELRSILTRAVMNENIVPKRWRPVFTFPLIELLRQLIHHIRAANKVYPYKPVLVDERKRLQSLAIVDCDYIDDELQYLLETLYMGKIDADQPMPADIEKAGDLLDRTESLLQSWRKSTKLLNYTGPVEQ